MNVNEERARILRLVAEGTVSPAEGEDLLAALEPPRGGSSTGGPMAMSVPYPPAPPAPQPLTQRRNLIIRVSEDGDTKVNVRIPLALARAAGKFIPRHAQEQLNEYGINIEHLLESLNADEVVGPLLEVQDEDDQVVIAIE